MKENSIEDIIEEKYTRYLNCETDILELTIEEAIFILEKDKKNHYVEDLLQEAYEVIISDYKRVLKENEKITEYTIHLTDEQYRRVIELAQNDINQQWEQNIKDKIEEYLDYDKKHKTYIKDGRENFTIEYFKAKALQELLEGKGE